MYCEPDTSHEVSLVVLVLTSLAKVGQSYYQPTGILPFNTGLYKRIKFKLHQNWGVNQYRCLNTTHCELVVILVKLKS